MYRYTYILISVYLYYTSVYLYAASLQKLAVAQTSVPLIVSLCNDPADPVFDGVGLVGFKSRANGFLLA